MKKSIVAVAGLTFSRINSAFDLSALLHADLQTEEISDKYIPIPENDYAIQFKAPKIEGGEKNGRKWGRLELPVTVIDPAVKDDMGIGQDEEVRSQYNIFLDLTDEGLIASGVNKNVALGQLLAALGMKEGEVKLSEIENKTALGRFKHKLNTETQRIRAELVAILPAE